MSQIELKLAKGDQYVFIGIRATQTEERLRRDNVRGKDAANATHYEVGRKVRQAIADIGGTMPENLAPAEDLVKIARKLKKAIIESSK